MGLIFINDHFHAPIQADPTYTYLPAARALLDQGWSFLLTEQSYEVTPLAYIWPAVWGVDPHWIRIANAGLWLGCVYFLWQTSLLLGGPRAGAVAMLLLLSPELVRYFPSEMTEPLYLFGIFGWMHAMARIVIAREHSALIVAQGASMLAITLLSRPVLQLIAPSLLIACVASICYWKIHKKRSVSNEWQPTIIAIAWSLGFALILPIALLIKNGIVFNLWGLGTGSGTGIYLGTHPLFQGAEPPFLGFNYDINALISHVTNTSNHLTLAGDRIARDAALWQVQTMDVGSATAFFARKLWWWLAHHPAQIEFHGKALRTFRLLELSLLFVTVLVIAFVWLRRRSCGLIHHIGTQRQLIFAGFLLLIFAGMLLQLLPILYNSRYSSNLLDPWIIPLTAFGLSVLLSPIEFDGSNDKSQWHFRVTSSHGIAIWQPIAALSLTLLMAISINQIARKKETIAVDPMRMGSTKIHVEIKDASRIKTYGMKAAGEKQWEAVESPFSIQMVVDSDSANRITNAHIFNALWETELSVNAPKGTCRKAEVSYQTEKGDILQPAEKLSLRPKISQDGKFHRIVTHANQELRPKTAGSLRIVMHCPIGTKVNWRATRFLESRHFEVIAEQLRNQQIR